jgi:hypothetical protein
MSRVESQVFKEFPFYQERVKLFGVISNGISLNIWSPSFLLVKVSGIRSGPQKVSS